MRRLLLLVGATIFVDTIFFAALTPLLPKYADDLGLSKAGVGVLAAAYPAGALLGGIPSGYAAARYGVKPVVVTGLLLMVVTTTAFGFAEDIVVLDLARFAQGFASSLTWTAGLAWLVSEAPPRQRGLLIGAAMSAAIVGALFGPVLGGVASVVGVEVAFAAVAALGLGLAVWAALMPAARAEHPQPLSMLWRAAKDRTVLGSVWFVTLPALLFSTMGVLAPLRLDVLGMSAVGISAVYLVSAAIEAALNPLAGRISDRRGRLAPIRFGLAASAIATALLPWPDSRWVLAGFVILAGMAFGLFWTPAMSHLADLAERRGLDYAYGFALVNVAWAPGQAFGAALGGALARATSDAVPYLLLTGVCLLSLAAVGPWRSESSS
ncbi:MAG TPA: MFS transporter [Gaiellaceae bacterium]|nr:MFS transporter [Gaiellaceae bacterium]